MTGSPVSGSSAVRTSGPRWSEARPSGPRASGASRLGGVSAARPSLVGFLAAAALTLVALDHAGYAGSLFGSFRAGARSALAPVESAGAAALRPARELSDGLGREADLAREIERLRVEAGAAGAAVAQAEALARDNDRLSAALGLAPVAGLPAVTARVLSLPTGRPGSTFLLDRGSADGLAPDMPVLAGSVLAGRVVSVAAHRAEVLPITDPGAVVGVRLGAAGSVGLARGAGPGRALRTDLLDPAAGRAKGDLAVTSGLQHSRFPAGLPVGRLLSTRGTPKLEPLADPTRLELVQVLTWQPAS